MKRSFLLSVCVSLCLSIPAFSGEMIDGVDITGGQNGFAQLKLVRASDSEEPGLLKLLVEVDDAQSLKGYGFVLNYDSDKYELVKTENAGEGLLNTGSGQDPLFLASSRDPGQIAVGAMKIDGEAANGNGRIVELTFRAQQTPLPSDFQVTDAILIDLDGSVDAVTNIEIGSLKPMPNDYALDQNMPNPFNPATTIGYQLPNAAPVRMVVYNLLGQQIKTLVNEQKDAGYYTVSWDGTDDLNRQVASGIYLYRIQAGAYSHTQRMLLLK